MTQATTKDYWISPYALHIERNALGYPDYIQASCVSGAQILVYVKDIIGYDAGHNYRRWPLQASPTVFNSHSEKYVYAAIPRDFNSTESARIVFPSEQIDIYGKNLKEEQIGNEKYYYIFLQGILTSSGDNGTEQRKWKSDIFSGYLSSNEAFSAGMVDTVWYKYETVNELVTFLKEMTMKAGTWFRVFYAKAVNIVSGGSITFEGQGALNGIAKEDTSIDSEDRIVTPKYLDEKSLSSVHDDIAQGLIRFMQGLKLGDGEKGIDAKGNAVLGDVVVDRVHDAKSTPAERVVVGAQGFDLYMGEDGKSHLYVDYLTTRVKIFAAGAEVRKVSYSGGTTIFSNAGSTIVKVAYIFNATGSKVIAYKCYAAADDGTTRTMNWWHVGMMALCQTFNVKTQRDGSQLANRYYWRLVVGVGQEVLADGKLYDYVILSNVKDFRGSDGVPCYGIKLLADGQNNVLSWGGVAVSVVSDNGMTSFASVFDGIEGGSTDDSDSDIASRVFYGYEPAEGGGEPDAPAPNDVIVQVGDQVRWKKYGNLIKLTTSTEDNATDNAPAFAMYHGLGAPYVDKKSGNTNPYQWKKLTSLDSPEKVLKNANNFMFFTNDNPDEIVSPISTTYEIIASSDTLVRDPKTLIVTPADITFITVKHYGSKTETLTTVLYLAKYTTQDDVEHEGHFVSALSELEVNLYDIKEITVFAHESINTVLTSRNIAILTDGEKGDKGDTGDKGTDAVTLVAEPSSLVFGTNKDTGKAEGSSLVSLYVNEGTKKRPYMFDFSIEATENFDDNGVYRQGDFIAVNAGKIKSQEIKIDENTTRYVSCTSASFTVSITYKEEVYKVKVPVFVDVESYVSRLEMTAQEYKLTFESLENDLKSGDPTTLKNYSTTVSNTSKRIALEATKETEDKIQQAGIYLDSGEIKMKADKTKYVNAEGKEVAVFDGNGLNADLINAKHVWAMDSGNNKVGHFGNCEIDACKVSDGVYAPLFVGSSTAAKAPFYVTSKGAIKATAGYIGDLQIVGGYLEEGVRSENYMRLGSAQLFFRNNSEGSFKMSIGNVVSNFVSDNFQTGGLKLEYKRNYEKPVGPGGETASAFQANYGLVLDVSGTMDQHSRENPIMAANPYPNGNHAIFIGTGDIAGFRPMLTKATTSRKISKMECVIVCLPPQDANIILTLPDDPEIGQYYKFIMRTGRYTGVSWGKVILKSTTSGKPITRYGASNSRECPLDWQFQVTELWFDGDYWVLQWHAQV